MWYHSKFFKLGVETLLVLLNLLLFFWVIPYFSSVYDFMKFVLSCLILGIVLYYLFRPVVSRLSKLKVPFFISITGIFLLLAFILATVSFYIIPFVLKPIQQVANAPTEKAAEVKAATMGFLNAFNIYSYDEIRNIVANYLLKIQTYVFQNAFDIFSALTHFAVILALTPFTLFYLLKDDSHFLKWFIGMVPSNYRLRVEMILQHLDEILLDFFHGQVTIACIVTGLTFICLSIVGIENVMFITFITFFLSLIPYLGTLLAILPAVFQGLTTSYFLSFIAGGVMILIHLIESNIITPQVMMKRFDIHPLTIILLIMTSFFFFGIVGPLWITPAYVFVRELLIEAYAFFRKEEERTPN